MGNCQYCGRSIKIVNEEENCPYCGNSPYTCWNCKSDVKGGRECSACSFFVCEKCGKCGKFCPIDIILEENPTLSKRELLEKAFNWKNGKVRLNCPDLVGISYAKGRLRNFAIKLKKENINNDLKIFKARIDIIEKFPLEKTWKICLIKEEGFFGQEYRDASNLAVCFGLAKKTFEKTKEGYLIEVFTRVDKEKCKYSNWDKLIVKECPKCKKRFDDQYTICDNQNCNYKKGIKKNQPRELRKINSYSDFCDLPRLEFKKKKEDVCDGVKRGN